MYIWNAQSGSPSYNISFFKISGKNMFFGGSVSIDPEFPLKSKYKLGLSLNL